MSEPSFGFFVDESEGASVAVSAAIAIDEFDEDVFTSDSLGCEPADCNGLGCAATAVVVGAMVFGATGGVGCAAPARLAAADVSAVADAAGVNVAVAVGVGGKSDPDIAMGWIVSGCIGGCNGDVFAPIPDERLVTAGAVAAGCKADGFGAASVVAVAGGVFVSAKAGAVERAALFVSNALANSVAPAA